MSHQDETMFSEILVVDDESAIRTALSFRLGRMGRSVQTVADGAAALEHCRNQLPQLVLLDVNLPDMQGYEVCEQIRRMGRNRPTIVMISACFPADPAARVARVGANGYLNKPIDNDELRAVVEDVFGSVVEPAGSREYEVDVTSTTPIEVAEADRSGEKPRRVLIVDNDEALVEAIRLRFEAAGWICDTALSGTQAVARYEHGGTDLVITDIAMPSMHGINLVQWLWRQGHVPVIVITGFSDEIHAKLHRMGQIDVMRKPFSISDLLDTATTAVMLGRETRAA